MLLVKDLVLPHGKTIGRLEISRNSGQVLRGANGSGKSLLLKSLSYLYNCKYSQFTFLDKTISEWKPEEYRARVLYGTSQPIMHPFGNVADYLREPFELQVHKGKKSLFDIQVFLSAWGIAGMELKNLSSGLKQMVSFLRNLSLNADLLLLDEPTAHLDPVRTRQLHEALVKWKDETKGSYLLISHDETKELGPVLDFESLVSQH